MTTTKHARLMNLRARLIELGHTGPTNARLVAVDRAIAVSRPWGTRVAYQEPPVDPAIELECEGCS